MKVLLVHNYYGSASPSGENIVFEAERDLLRSNGHEVESFTRHSDEIRSRGVAGVVIGAFATPWNPISARDIQRAVDAFSPDVVHVHNTFPLISPAIFHAIPTHTARVLTLHNYRLLCPAAIPMREGRLCTECIAKRSVEPALRYGCYRGSRIATAPLAVSVALHRRIGTWTQQVDAFIALSEFQRDLMVDGGLPAAKLHVKPNFVVGPAEVCPWTERPGYVVFVGRLSEEKGLRTLLRAWCDWGAQAPELRIIGEGPLRNELEGMAHGLRVSFFGQLQAEQAKQHIAHAHLLVLPSEGVESFGMVVCEALAHGTPAVVSRRGPLPSLVEDGGCGLVFEPGNAKDLLDVVQPAFADRALLERLGSAAREAYERRYTPERGHDLLLNVYQRALAQKDARLQ